MRLLSVIALLMMTVACRFERPGDVVSYGDNGAGAQGTQTSSGAAPGDAQRNTLDRSIQGDAGVQDGKAADQNGQVGGGTSDTPPPRSQLLPGQSLGVNETLTVTTNAGCRFELILQGDGNLVLYYNGTAKWSSATVNQGGQRLLLQTDGNLVLYTAANTAVWNTRTFNQAISHLVLQSDGNLVLYRTNNSAAWNSGSVVPGC
ncbi:MAG: hypothetical protein RIQ81_561 [Pseudomonadota bacterium]